MRKEILSESLIILRAWIIELALDVAAVPIGNLLHVVRLPIPLKLYINLRVKVLGWAVIQGHVELRPRHM